MEVWHRLTSDNDYEWRWSPHLSASVTSYQIPDLQVGEPYLFSVRGINREGAGHFSDMVEAKGVPTVINRDPDKSGKARCSHPPPSFYNINTKRVLNCVSDSDENVAKEKQHRDTSPVFDILKRFLTHPNAN